mmetsp:Transcript_38582/g.49220  ORF Transcript_38582/g.49220 Transcript_38582/m.49220 type:complete len:208 (+) Transcript_38582:62-685(+)
MFSKESIHPPILNQQEFHKKKKKGEVDDNDKTFTFAHTIAKDQWILEKLFEFTSSVGNIRLLCKSLNHLVENNLYKLRVGSGIPRRTLQRIMLKMPKLRIVDFSNMKSDLNDRQVLAVYETLPLLQYLDVTDCPNLTERILVCKPAGIFLKIRGCWRAISPNPFFATTCSCSTSISCSETWEQKVNRQATLHEILVSRILSECNPCY